MLITAETNEHGIYPISALKEFNEEYSSQGDIALVDADLLDGGTRHPNLVIMKLSGYFKGKGCNVRLIENYSELFVSAGNFKELNDYSKSKNFSAIYISKVFDFTHIDKGLLMLPNVWFGGTGFFFDHAPMLPYEIEHHMPDYHIYDEYIAHDTSHKNKMSYYKDYLNFSIGFATKGCFRQCDFCVNHNVKKVEFHAHVSEFFDPSRKYIYLWDDNILGYSHWRDVFEELAETGRKFQFRQGMDLRLMTPDKAKVLSKAKYYGDYIFAFDNIEDAPMIEKKLKLWREYCDKETKLYVLSGFVSQDADEIESVFERIRILIKYGCFPYIMRHEFYLNSPYRGLFVQIARWCNQPGFMRNMSFREFCIANQKYHKNPNTLCASLQEMLDFEKKYPKIAEKYFDMRFKDQKYVIKLKEKNAALRKAKGGAK